MLENWYNNRLDEIDLCIKKGIENISDELNEITKEEKKTNYELINKLEENYNTKIDSISKEVYLRGFKDGINLILECKKECK